MYHYFSIIFQVFRKAAFKIAGENNQKTIQIVVDNQNIENFVGRPKFTTDRLYDATPIGVIMGLAWTAMGRFIDFPKYQSYRLIN